MSRLSRIKLGGASGLAVAQYRYNGLSSVVRTELPEPQAFTTLDGADSGAYRTYPKVDRFNRVTGSRWVRDLTTDRV